MDGEEDSVWQLVIPAMGVLVVFVMLAIIVKLLLCQ